MRTTMDYDGYIFDLDGTIYLSQRLLANADQVVRELIQAGRRIVFLSNKPIESRENYAKKLNAMGIPADLDSIVNSSLVTAQCIAAESPNATIYCIGEPPLWDELRAAGLELTEEPLAAEFLVVAFDRTFTYEKLHKAMLALENGARYFATNPDRTCPVDGGHIPDCAGMIGAIQGVTGRSPELICGKPSEKMLAVALDRLHLKAGQCLMVGDRLETDIQMGIDLNVDTALVLTGVTTATMAAEAAVKPTFVLGSVADIPKRKSPTYVK